MFFLQEKGSESMNRQDKIPYTFWFKPAEAKDFAEKINKGTKAQDLLLLLIQLNERGDLERR